MLRYHITLKIQTIATCDSDLVRGNASHLGLFTQSVKVNTAMTSNTALIENISNGVDSKCVVTPDRSLFAPLTLRA